MYINDNLVIFPLFDDDNDNENIAIIKKVFNNKKIIFINCKELILGKSGLHSIICYQSFFN